MSLFELIAERKIREAQQQGAFNDLPGAGKPLLLEDDSLVPEELRMAYKILKNASFLPPELELHKEILRLQDLLKEVTCEHEKIRQLRKINLLITRLNLMRRRPIGLEMAQQYGPALAERLTKQD
jgi:hypothetical protein